MAARRKPRKSPARRTTATAKIRVHTDEYGRKVYTVVGTKKFAYTLAKAKEIASKSKAGKKRASTKKSTALTTTRKRKATTTKRRTTARRTTGAKRNAKGQFVKAGRRTATRRNALKSPSAHMTRTRAARTAKLDERSARLIQSDAMYDIHSSLYTKGLKPRKGRSVGEAEGKREAVRLAEAYIVDQGVEGMLYREDVGNSVIYRGKEGSGLGGMIEIYPINDDEVLANYAGMKFTALARRNPVTRSAGERADRRDRIRAANTHRVEQNAMYEVYSTLSVAGRKFPGGLIEEVEGKHDGLAVANEFLERFGIKDLVYREDRGHDVVFRGKVGSGVRGVLDIAAINPEEALRGRGSSKAWRRLAKL